MASTTKTARVAGTPAEVLDVVAELDHYPEWAGGITAVEVVEEIDGWPVRARFTLDQPPISDTYVLDYSWDVAESGVGRISWTLAERGSVISQLDGSYDLAADGTGTQVTYNLVVDVSLPLPGLLKRAAEKKIVTTALEDLARRVAG